MKRYLCVFLLAGGFLPALRASDGGGSVYPFGAETVMPGLMPPPGRTMFEEFTDFYSANAVVDGSGHSLVPGFHLRVGAVALKLIHDWNVRALGGALVSSVGVPILYEHLSGPFGRYAQSGMGNPDIGVLDVAYARGAFHWWYGVDAFTPGAPYTKGVMLNTGQHNYAVAPVGAFTWMPHEGRSVLSSRVEYIDNFTNPATEYRSGHELTWEYAAMQNFGKKLSAGVNGFFYQQTSDDVWNAMAVAGGDRGRTLGIGPQIQYHAGRVELIVKYSREMAVENRPRGSSLWLQVGLPLWHPEK